jgi:hypothetical protein
MTDGIGRSLVARTETFAGLSIASDAQIAANTKTPRAVFNFLIEFSDEKMSPAKAQSATAFLKALCAFVPLREKKFQLWGWRRLRRSSTTIRPRRTENLSLAVLRDHKSASIRRRYYF